MKPGRGRMPGIKGACVYASSPCGLLGELYATPHNRETDLLMQSGTYVLMQSGTYV